jgi:hypothetical protein
VWQDTSKGNGCADQGIQFLVSADGELQVARRNALDFEVLRSVLFKGLAPLTGTADAMTHSGKFEDFGGEIFEDGRDVDCGLGSNAHLVLGVVLQEALDTTAGELQTETVSKAGRATNVRTVVLRPWSMLEVAAM